MSPAVTGQSRLEIPLGAAHIKVEPLSQGKTPKATNDNRSGVREVEDRKVNAAVHGNRIAGLDAFGWIYSTMSLHSQGPRVQCPEVEVAHNPRAAKGQLQAIVLDLCPA